ncbi:hypothetical protein J7T55_001399 [Diaporthe amygdali]|uniref:uncharacterized protein n=1 Tax=Phomopsis amygdali TaxID=1214568 RepID=UPI0022FEF02B|nr:uncharacterized protein J7T55_001399 [Diaporthe amygdali]KAJ0114992.1 hypothetical protein J7T55_001399 [Diaporthe amygdali]
MTQYKPLQKRSPGRHRWSSTWWWQEIISIIASFGCMIAVVVILRTMQDKQMDHWTFFVGISSFLLWDVFAEPRNIGIAACIGQWKWVYISSKRRRLLDIDIIEDASRGPLGSLQMIATIPWGWATLGAIITVLGLGIDTFAQQVISTEAVTDWVNDGTASFKFAHDYFTGVKVSVGGGYWIPDRNIRHPTLQWDLAYELHNDHPWQLFVITCASHLPNTFTFGSTEKIHLEEGYVISDAHKSDNSNHILFNTTGLPEFRVSILDLAALLDCFPSDSFSGTLVDGEEMPVFAQGITAAIRSPEKNISSLLDSMALSMTDQLRTSVNATIAPGLTAKSVLLVRIQWAWLVLPFFVVLASAAFLIAEMAESRRTRDVMLWKSTATSMLFHSVKPAEGVMRMDVQSPKQLQGMVKNTSVKLDPPSH